MSHDVAPLNRPALRRLAATRPWPAPWVWVHVGVAALAMAATLPGRTHGLGLITKPMLAELPLDPVSYGVINLWATLLGALFCVPAGRLIDRWGSRPVLFGLALGLGGTVVAMSQLGGGWRVETAGTVLLPDLFLLVLLTRGLGQSALSVASLTLISRSSARRTGLVMGVYAFATSAGFMAAYQAIRSAERAWAVDWRSLWAGIGVAVAVLGTVGALLVRPAVERAGGKDRSDELREPSLSLGRALRSPAFWTFSLAISLFGLISSGVTLYNELILNELDFGREVYLNVLMVGVPFGLASNLLTGWLATRWSLRWLLAAATAVMAAALAVFPWVKTEPQVYAYAATFAAAGGAITVCFFTVWRRAYGPAHLGSIQGAAQMLTVLASALGPVLFALCQRQAGSYLPIFPWLALTSAALAVAVAAAPLPRPDAAP
jgi:MFS family permease